MNIEFHYYITYLVALNAGFNKKRAYKIAYSSQFVDDNHQQINVVDEYNRTVYCSTPTQIQMLSLGKKRDEILMMHHFLPGDRTRRSLVTTADCSLGEMVLKMALTMGDDFLIGIASHAYADTWAHQNFIGRRDKLNGMDGLHNYIIPNVGHADALDDPDCLDACWTDTRLPDKKSISNNIRFLDAACHLYLHYCRANYITADCKSLRLKLQPIFNHRARKRFDRSAMMDYRKKQYNALVKKISAEDIPLYRKEEWFDAALLEIKGNNVVSSKYLWRNKAKFANYNWWRFQEAAKHFQQIVLPIVEHRHGAEINA